MYNDGNLKMKIINPRAFKFSIQSQIDKDLENVIKTKKVILPDLSKSKIKNTRTQIPSPKEKINKLKDRMKEITKNLYNVNNQNYKENKNDKLFSTLFKSSDSFNTFSHLDSIIIKSYKFNRNEKNIIKKENLNQNKLPFDKFISQNKTKVYEEILKTSKNEKIIKGKRNLSPIFKLRLNNLIYNKNIVNTTDNIKTLKLNSNTISIFSKIDEDFHYYSEM